MGRGGARLGAGRPGWHGKVEACLRLDVRTMQRHGCLAAGRSGMWVWKNGATSEQTASIRYLIEGEPAAGVLVLRYSCNGEPREDRVPLTHTHGPVGGIRPWFVCPLRGERVATLYQRHGRFACRRCNRLAYMSQSEDWLGRVWRQQRKLENRLAGRFVRPPRMHLTTYRRLVGRILEYENMREDFLAPLMRQSGILV